MLRFNFYRPESLEDVAEKLAAFPGRSRTIAGGTDLLVQIRENEKKLETLEMVIDLSVLDSKLRFVKDEGDYIAIGATSTHTDLEHNPIILEHFPFLATACGTVGSPLIRNRGTIGGCVCNASPAADPVPVLMACDTDVEIQGVNGRRMFPLGEFIQGSGKVALADDEFVIAFHIKKLPQSAKTGFVKLGRRKALAIARLNAAAVLVFDDAGWITAARLSPGSVFQIPSRVLEAEEHLINKKPSKELFQEVGAIVSEEMIARTGVRWSTVYKKPVVETIVADALCLAAAMEVF